MKCSPRGTMRVAAAGIAALGSAACSEQVQSTAYYYDHRDELAALGQRCLKETTPAELVNPVTSLQQNCYNGALADARITRERRAADRRAASGRDADALSAKVR
jgi:hypothetical protein